MSFDGELNYDPYSGKYKRAKPPHRLGPCACGCLILAMLAGASGCLLMGTLLGFGANEAIRNRDEVVATELAQALTETALARPPATEVVVQPPTLPPTTTPTSTNTPTVTPLPSSTPRPTQVPPTPTPTLTAVPRTIIPPNGNATSAVPAGRVLWSGDLIAVASGDTIHLLDANAFGQDGIKISTSSDIQDIAFSADGSMLAAAAADGTVILWDVRNPVQSERLGRLVVSNVPVWSVAFDPQNRWLAAGTDDGRVRLWQVQDQVQILTQIVQSGPIFALAFDAEGNRLAAGGSQRVSLFDVQATGELVSTQTLTVRGDVVRMAFDPVEDDLALATTDDAGDMELWKLDPNERIALQFHQRKINDVRFSNDGLLLISGSADGSVQLWIVTDVEIATWHTLDLKSPVVSVAINHDATQLVTLTEDKTLTLWDIGRGDTLEKRKL